MEREIVRVGDNCPECQANTDPRKVPVHPNCNCEVITQNVETGVAVDVWQPIEQWVRDAGKLRFVPGNLGQVAGDVSTVEPMADPLLDLTMEALTFEPSSAIILDLADSRWADIERWLMQVQPLINTGEYVVTVMDLTGSAGDIQDTLETVETLITTHDVLDELVGRRRLLVALARAVIG